MVDITVIKRDGSHTDYDKNKIQQAILQASKRTTYNDIIRLMDISDDIHLQILKLTKQNIKIDEIQELVERNLIRYGLEDVAREYIEYRTNENSNKDSKLISTQRDLLAGVIAEDYAKKHILPKYIVNAHESGEIHYHDLSNSPFQPSVNCCLVDLKNMLKDGFKCGNADIEQPKSITVAATVTTQIIAAVASSIYGGTSINRIDEILAPYVLKSYEKHLQIAKEYTIPDAEKYARERTEKETYDACQILEYQVNSLYTTNG